MEGIRILGGTRLSGKVRIQGSKNAALPILAATLLTNDTNYLSNCPKIADVYKMIEIMKCLGCSAVWDEKGLKINTVHLRQGHLPKEAIAGMRSSLCLLGALVGKCKNVEMEYPGGCVIGDRPIDLHIGALTKMGVEFIREENRIHATVKHLKGAVIRLPFPSVGATENIILAAVCAWGDTEICGAAREPEICALCRFLNACGAKIRGAGTGKIVICGKEKLHGIDFEIPSDRIVAGTYLLTTVGTGGTVLLKNAPVREMEIVLRIAKKMGACCHIEREGLYVEQKIKPQQIPYLYTAPYPGFPTDLQSVFLTVRCIGDGECCIEEKIFENRFRVVEALESMGADIRTIDRHRVLVTGVNRLTGGKIEAKELRGGAALVTAGLLATGESLVTGTEYIDRGYENICKDLRELGARIVSV